MFRIALLGGSQLIWAQLSECEGKRRVIKRKGRVYVYRWHSARLDFTHFYHVFK